MWKINHQWIGTFFFTLKSTQVSHLPEFFASFSLSFCEVGPHWHPRTQVYWPIALYLSFKFIGDCLGVQPPYWGPRSHSASPLLSVPDSSWQNPRSTSLPFPTPGIRIECAPTFSAPHLLHEGIFALLILNSVYCRLICSIRSPINILPCFLSSILMNWTYLSVGPSRHSWLVPYIPQTFHSVSFLFSIQFLILDLNLIKDSGRKGSGPIGLVLAPSLASLSAVSFCWIPLCAGTHIMVTWFTSDRTVIFSIHSTISSDFVPLATRVATAVWLPVQIMICSFASHFLRQLVTQSIHSRNLCLKGCNILSQWDVPLYFALIFTNSCPSPLLITGSICEPDLPFSQPIGPVFVPLLPCRYHSPVFTKRASPDYVVFYHAELVVLVPLSRYFKFFDEMRNFKSS